MTEIVVRPETNSDVVVADDLERALLKVPQDDAPVRHLFGPGVYIREVHLPAGRLAIGHMHRHAHLNVMLRGKLVLLDGDGVGHVLTAPQMFTAPAGRKIAWVLEPVVWQNIVPNVDDERDVEVLEARMLDKSAAFLASEEQRFSIAVCERAVDRADFERFLVEFEWPASVVRERSERTDDQIPMPVGYDAAFTVRRSPIEGRGAFASAPFAAGAVIAPARVAGMRTPAGRFVNHAAVPNAHYVSDDIGDLWLVALRPIRGCVGGDDGEEITVDYRQSVAINLEVTK